MSIPNRSVVTRRGCFLGIASNTILTRVVTKCFLAREFKIYALIAFSHPMSLYFGCFLKSIHMFFMINITKRKPIAKEKGS